MMNPQIILQIFLSFFAFSGLRQTKLQLLTALQQCNSNECRQVQKEYEIGRLDENNIHYDQVSLRLTAD
jgi:hypothetical protein